MPTLRLTDISVRALKGSEKYETYWDTQTPAFGIRVGKRTKTWTVMRGRSRERITIGKYPDLSLSDARAEAKKLLAANDDHGSNRGRVSGHGSPSASASRSFSSSRSDRALGSEIFTAGGRA